MMMTMKSTHPWKFLIGAALVAVATPTRADLARDANTTRIVGEEGNWVMENALQLEKDNDGKTWAVETAVQYAPSDRVQLLLEPTLWERDEPKDGSTESGVGDTDFTIAYLVLPDEGLWPAVIVAGKVKIPTADNREIGTGKADYSASLIIGKEFGELDVSLELEYETFGDPPSEPVAMDPAGEPLDPDEMAVDSATAEEVELKDQFIYTLSIDYGLTENLGVFVEIFGNSEPTKDEDSSNAVGVGLEYDIELTDYANPFIEVGVDTDDLVSAKVGVEWNW